MTVHDDNAERETVGAALVAGPDRLLDTGLEPRHFADPVLATIWRAIGTLHTQGDPVTAITVHDELDRAGHPVPLGRLHELAAVTTLGAAAKHARIVIDRYRWRTVTHAAQAALDAADRRDQDAFDAAIGALTTSDTTGSDTLPADPQAVARRALDRLEQGSLGRSTPWPVLDRQTAGTLLQPGDVTLIAGWTSAGKSAALGNVLAHVATRGATVRVYTNEMQPEDYVDRWLAAQTGVPYQRIVSRKLERDDWRALHDHAPRFPLHVQQATDWSAARVAADVRRHRPDVWALDLFNRLPAPGKNPTGEADHASRILNAAANATGTHGLVVCQLNQERAKTTTLPAPVLRDIRGTGQLANDATAVVFVHRSESDDDGRAVKTPDGLVFVAKNRKGPLGAVRVRFDAHRQVFTEALDVVPGTVLVA